MKLEQVILSRQTTIANKRRFLQELEDRNGGTRSLEDLVNRTTCELLRVNLVELNNILDHLRLVEETNTKAAAESTIKATEDSCKTNPDRMRGCYTFEEIAESRGWR